MKWRNFLPTFIFLFLIVFLPNEIVSNSWLILFLLLKPEATNKDEGLSEVFGIYSGIATGSILGYFLFDGNWLAGKLWGIVKILIVASLFFMYYSLEIHVKKVRLSFVQILRAGVLIFLAGIIIYSYQVVGFYWMIKILNGKLSRIWLILLVSGLRFLIQSMFVLGIIKLLTNIGVPLRTYLTSSAPLVIAGSFNSLPRILYSGSGIRPVMEGLVLMLGVVGFWYLLSKEVVSHKKSMWSYAACAVAILIAFILVPPPM